MPRLGGVAEAERFVSVASELDADLALDPERLKHLRADARDAGHQRDDDAAPDALAAWDQTVEQFLSRQGKLGLHAGSCIAVTTGDALDYFVATVNIAARLEHECRGGEVIVSEAVAKDAETEAALADRERLEETAMLRGVSAPVQSASASAGKTPLEAGRAGWPRLATGLYLPIADWPQPPELLAAYWVLHDAPESPCRHAVTGLVTLCYFQDRYCWVEPQFEPGNFAVPGLPARPRHFKMLWPCWRNEQEVKAKGALRDQLLCLAEFVEQVKPR